MAVFTDQVGRIIELNKTPGKIISIVPSQTELLCDLGLNEQVIGITKFCIHPQEWFQIKKRVGGTKQLNIELIRELKPDLIIANKEENVKEQIDELEKYFPVWTSDINNLPSAYDMIMQVGILTGKTREANQLVEKIKTEFSNLPVAGEKPKTIYLIWRNPYMTVGGDTFINAMLDAAGFDNVFKHISRYPEINIEELKIQDPDIVLLPSEPFPFKEKHLTELKQLLPNTKIMFADGEMFSWYGSRLLKAPAYFSWLKEEYFKQS